MERRRKYHFSVSCYACSHYRACFKLRFKLSSKRLVNSVCDKLDKLRDIAFEVKRYSHVDSAFRKTVDAVCKRFYIKLAVKIIYSCKLILACSQYHVEIVVVLVFSVKIRIKSRPNVQRIFCIAVKSYRRNKLNQDFVYKLAYVKRLSACVKRHSKVCAEVAQRQGLIGVKSVRQIYLNRLVGEIDSRIKSQHRLSVSLIIWIIV